MTNPISSGGSPTEDEETNSCKTDDNDFNHREDKEHDSIYARNRAAFSTVVMMCCLVLSVVAYTLLYSTHPSTSPLTSSLLFLSQQSPRHKEKHNIRQLQSSAHVAAHHNQSQTHNHTHPIHPTQHIPYHKCPNLLPSLDHLVHQNKSRVRVFVTYHNSAGAQVIQNITCHHTRKWIVPVLCNATKYFEYYAYKLFNKMTIKDFKDVDYVAIAGYKNFAPSEWNMIRGVPYSAQDPYLQGAIQFAAKHPEFEVFPFFRDSGPVIKTLPKYHGHNALHALIETLRHANWSEAEIQDSTWAYAIYRNSYLARPAAFLEIARLMTQMIDIAENDPAVSPSYNNDAGYSYPVKETAMQIFGTPYYMLHPFVMERMLAVVIDHMHVSTYFQSFGKMMEETNSPWPPPEPKETSANPPAISTTE